MAAPTRSLSHSPLFEFGIGIADPTDLVLQACKKMVKQISRYDRVAGTHAEKIKVPGYSSLTCSPRTAILVKRTLTTQAHEIEDIGIEHTIVEIILTRKTQQSLYLANLYSPPRKQLHQCDHFVHELRQTNNGNRLIIVGDFNAPHVAWGYHRTTKKGVRVHDAAQQHGLTPWNDLLHPTRLGNSVSRDTNPFLTFTRDVHNATWTRLPTLYGVTIK
ncbi:hypothetical protein HPB51_028940 [Rhipicephalus microplus]|uniref:Endonuclease/exonuclease/phosphatase domain-containing protein n=1 Tax=Rhipicephalus microplus TaxID=6941 RepID=A0A9J6CVI6_RHIMP|nr:hypothetical protein HPB51_028940 [Rhipicephalus microplus]